MRVRAAVLREPGLPVEIREVELAPPRAGEVLVRIAACGVCRSDLHVVDGDIPEPLPLVPGHEASGVVEAVGAGVERVHEGDHVVLALVPSCGRCEQCLRGRASLCELGGRMAAAGTLADGTSRLSLEGETLHHFNAVSSFAEHAVVPESVAVSIRRDVPLAGAALIGCAALTGWGAVTRTARVEPGSRVAVWGCGGVGLVAVQAARLAGADAVVAVDSHPEKLELAERLGATDTLHARPTADTARRVRAKTGGGVDVAVEAIGREETIRAAWNAVRPGGTAVVVGLPPKGTAVAIDTWGFINEKTLTGCFLGSARIDEDVPRLADLYAEGRLQLDELVSDRIGLDDLPTAFARLRSGHALRQLVVF